MAFREASCADTYCGLRGLNKRNERRILCGEAKGEKACGASDVFRAYLTSLANGEAAEIKTLRYELDAEESEATGIVVVEIGKLFPGIRFRVFVMSDVEDVEELLGRFGKGAEGMREGVDELDEELWERDYGREHVEMLVGMARTLLVTAMGS